MLLSPIPALLSKTKIHQSEEMEMDLVIAKKKKKLEVLDFFSALPEGCVSDILSLTSPRDVCRLSAVCNGSKSVADSDAVWGRFLPSDHRGILSRSVSPVPFSTNKQLYFRLSNSPILLDGGKLSFALDISTGKKCFMLGARELAILRGNAPQCWEWRFSEVAEFLKACWFDVKGKIEARLLSPKTTYAAYLVFKFSGRYKPNRFDFVPAKASVRVVGEIGDGDEDAITKVVCLCSGQFFPRWSGGRYTQKRMDKWMEIELGEFFNGEGDSGEVEMRLMELRPKRGQNWKLGVAIEGIELRPKFNS